MDRIPPQLYLITPPRIEDVDAFLKQLDAALEGGPVAALQIRLKAGEALDREMTRTVGKQLVPYAQARGLAVFINDDADLAAELGADGVHLGQEDGSVVAARDMLGPDGIIGVTCHDSRHLALEAGEAGADYVAFGAFYPTQTKAPKTTATADLLSWWQEMTELPCVAIGGITPQNAAPLVSAGADFLAVSGAVWNATDGPAAAVAAFASVLETA